MKFHLLSNARERAHESVNGPLSQVHELTDIERKYWLQFAKLQTTNMVRVYEKEAEPKNAWEQDLNLKHRVQSIS